MSVYDTINQILQERGISRHELARMTGISYSNIASLFARKPEYFPSKYAEPIGKALGVSFAMSYGDKVDPDNIFPAGITTYGWICNVITQLLDLPHSDPDIVADKYFEDGFTLDIKDDVLTISTSSFPIVSFFREYVGYKKLLDEKTITPEEFNEFKSHFRDRGSFFKNDTVEVYRSNAAQKES